MRDTPSLIFLVLEKQIHDFLMLALTGLLQTLCILLASCAPLHVSQKRWIWLQKILSCQMHVLPVPRELNLQYETTVQTRHALPSKH